MALDSSLAAESANVFRMLGNLHLLHLLAQGGTISSTVFSGNTDLLSALGHFES